MTLQVPDYIRSIAPYVPGKPIEETQREFKLKKVVKLASNENPLGSSPKGVLAARKAMRDLHRYPDSSAFRLKAKLSKFLGVTPQELLVGNGSNEIIDFLIRTYCLPGDSLVTSHAAFLAYKLCAQIHGVKAHEVPMTPDLRFDLPALAKAVKADPRAKIVFIANPNNPTGTYARDAELRGFLDEIAALSGRSVLVALDCAYQEYVSAQDLSDPLPLLHKYPNVVILRTFSKIYGLAGLRAGYLIGHPEITATVEKIRQPFNANSLALAAAEAALDDQAFVRRARKVNDVGMKFWETQLARLGIPFWKSQGNFLLIDTLTGMGRQGSEIFAASLKRGVIFRPVANYGLDQALRISIGTPAENRFAVQALEKVMNSGEGVAAFGTATATPGRANAPLRRNPAQRSSRVRDQ